jgi:hypothetical protein
LRVVRANDGRLALADDPLSPASGSRWRIVMARTTRIVAFFSAAFTVLVLLCVPLIGQADANTYTFGIRLDHEPSSSAPVMKPAPRPRR